MQLILLKNNFKSGLSSLSRKHLLSQRHMRYQHSAHCNPSTKSLSKIAFAFISMFAISACVHTAPKKINVPVPAECSSVSAEINHIVNAQMKQWKDFPELRDGYIKKLGTGKMTFGRMTSSIDVLIIKEESYPEAIAVNKLLGNGLIYGDPHMGNMARNDKKSRPYINDFDDATHGPRALDLLRFLRSIDWSWPETRLNKYSKLVAEGYIHGLTNGWDTQLEKMDGTIRSEEVKERKEIGQPKIKPNDPSPQLEQWAKNEFSRFMNFDPKEFDKKCWNIEFNPFKGGASFGLPRFRIQCGSREYEVKSLRAATYDSLQNLNPRKAIEFGQDLVANRKALAPDDAGKFSPVSKLSDDAVWDGLGGYIYYREGEDFMGPSSQQASSEKVVYIAAGLIGEAHAKAGLKLNIPAKEAEAIIQSWINAGETSWTKRWTSSFETLPGCLKKI